LPAPPPPAALWTALGGNIYNTSQTGNVGVNTTTPQTTLDVNGPIRPGLVVAGDACTNQVGAIGHDSNGNQLTCGSTSVWGTPTTGITGWVTVPGCTISSQFIPNGGNDCDTNVSPLQVCQNAGYVTFTGACIAGAWAAPFTGVQGSVTAQTGGSGWAIQCYAGTYDGQGSAVGLQILCTH
jgi:hypothetical protein